MTTNGNAFRGERGANNSNLYNKPNYTTKKWPPYSRRIEDLRRRGLVPAKRVMVTTSWLLGAAFPRVVITQDQPVTNLRFEYLAGLHVQIVHFDSDAPILLDLISEILIIKPATLAAFNMDAIKRGEPAFKMIFSQSIMEAA